MELQHKVKDRHDFISTLVTLFNTFIPEENRLTVTEHRLIVFLLLNYPKGANFEPVPNRKLFMKHFRISLTGSANYLRAFLNKGWLERIEGEHDEYYLNPIVESFRELKNNTDIKINLSYGQHANGEKRAQ